MQVWKAYPSSNWRSVEVVFGLTKEIQQALYIKTVQILEERENNQCFAVNKVNEKHLTSAIRFL
jgi:hypothetical protein